LILDEEEWTPWNGLLSSIGKPCRPALKLRYRPLLLGEKVDEEEAQVAKRGEEKKQEEKSLVTTSSSSNFEDGDLNKGLVELLLETLPSLQENSSSSSFRLGL
jgi:hypothetical protein